MKTRKGSESDIIHETDEIASNEEDQSSDPKTIKQNGKRPIEPIEATRSVARDSLALPAPI